jgi:hypothetical protein
VEKGPQHTGFPDFIRALSAQIWIWLGSVPVHGRKLGAVAMTGTGAIGLLARVSGVCSERPGVGVACHLQSLLMGSGWLCRGWAVTARTVGHVSGMVETAAASPCGPRLCLCRQLMAPSQSQPCNAWDKAWLHVPKTSSSSPFANSAAQQGSNEGSSWKRWPVLPGWLAGCVAPMSFCFCSFSAPRNPSEGLLCQRCPFV